MSQNLKVCVDYQSIFNYFKYMDLQCSQIPTSV